MTVRAEATKKSGQHQFDGDAEYEVDLSDQQQEDRLEAKGDTEESVG